jgi:flagellar motor switch protein FliN/FliY
MMPLHWVKTIEQTLIDTGAIPLWGAPPPPPWDELARSLAALLQSDALSLSAKATRVLSREERASLFEMSPVPLTLYLSPIKSPLFFLVGKEELASITSWGLVASGKGFLSSSLQEGFYYYLCTHLVSLLNEAHAWQDLTLQLAKSEPLPDEECACIDIEIRHPKQLIVAKLLCPISFHSAFKAHFSTPQTLPQKNRSIEVPLRLTLGTVNLQSKEWKGVRPGDFILLDRCSFDPETKKGTLTLSLGEKPLFYTRLKEGYLKIVDYATYYEETEPMDDSLPPSDEEFHEDESTFAAETGEDSAHLWSSDTDELVEPKNASTHSIPAQNVPLTLTIELARLRMNLDKVLELSPGNTLELPLSAQGNVHVVIGGKKVAEAELIKLGERLGVRILTLET